MRHWKTLAALLLLLGTHALPVYVLAEPAVPATLAFYQPTAEWVVKLVLPSPTERRPDGGVFAEVVHAPASEAALQGQRMWLQYGIDKKSRDWFKRQNQDVRFGEEAAKSRKEGAVLPDALDGWKKVSPLESLAAARPGGELLVRLDDPALTGTTLKVASEPIQISAPEMALVQFQKKTDTNLYEVRHYNPAAKDFSGPLETIHIDQATGVPDPYLQPGNVEGIEKQALNAKGWMIYGARNGEGVFSTKSLEPRALSLVDSNPTHIENGLSNCLKWRNELEWADLDARKGTVEQSYLNPGPPENSNLAAAAKPGKKYLLLHVFGANEQTPKTMGLVTGHFSYGVATVKPNPFTGEAMYEVIYNQIYVQTSKGIVSGKLAWHEYMGHFNRGWMYGRPVSDVLVDVPELFEPFTLAGKKYDASVYLSRALEATAAKYRHGKGGGASLVTLTESCMQDSNQSVLNAIEAFRADLWADKKAQTFIKNHPNDPEVIRLTELNKIASDYKGRLGKEGLLSQLGPFKIPRFFNKLTGRWRTAVPRRGHDEVTGIFLKNGKPAVVLESFQIGGDMAHIRPLEPTSFLRNQGMLGADGPVCGWFWRLLGRIGL